MARTPRPFGPDLRDSSISSDLARLLGYTTFHRQAYIVTLAPVKADAIALLQETGLVGPRSGHYVTGRTGNDIAALLEAGLLRVGSALVYRQHTKDEPIARVTPGQPPVIVAHWRHHHSTGITLDVEDGAVDSAVDSADDSRTEVQ